MIDLPEEKEAQVFCKVLSSVLLKILGTCHTGNVLRRHLTSVAAYLEQKSTVDNLLISSILWTQRP